MTETKRKVELITLESPTDSSKKSKTSNVNTFSNYLLYSDDSGKFEVVNDLVKTYINVLFDNINKYDKKFDKFKYCIQMFIKTVEDIKEKNPTFLNQKHFKNLINSFAKEIDECTKFEQIPDLNVELNLELRRIIMPVEKKNTQVTGEKLRIHIGKMTEAMIKIQDQISKIETLELSADDMLKPSVYTNLPRLQKKLVKLWKRREALLNRSDFTGRKLFKTFSFNGTTNKDVNKIIENYFNRYLNIVKNTEEKMFSGKAAKKKSQKGPKNVLIDNFSFFTIIELRKYVDNEIEKSKIDYPMSEVELLKIYKTLLDENKNRRMQDQHDSFRTIESIPHLKPESTADEKDPEFEKEMSENGKLGQKTLQNLIDRYREIDYQNNGEKLQEGKPWDDDKSEDSVSSDDESEEEEEEEDDEEGEDDNDSVLNDIVTISDDDDD